MRALLFPLFQRILITMLLSAGLFFLLPLAGVERPVLRLLITLLLLAASVTVIIMITFRLLFIQLRDTSTGQSEGGEGGASFENAWQDALRQETSEALHLLAPSGPGRHTSPGHRIYLVMGPSGSGKTALLENSGLTFDHTYPSSAQLSGRMMNFCRWRISARSTYIEVPESGASSETHIPGKYHAFLDLLKRGGRTFPADGIILAVNLQDLLQDGLLAERAAAARNMVLGTLHTLELELPVYIVFTHCDIFPGFSDTFGRLQGLEAGQIFGAALSAAGSGAGTSPKQKFEKEFRQLCKSLKSTCFKKLKDASDADQKEQIFRFPGEFRASGPRLAAFIELLFKESLQPETPLFRGFFFTSVLFQTPASSHMRAEFSAHGFAGFSSTILSHPLYPGASISAPHTAHEARNPSAKALFTGILFNGLLNTEQRLARFPKTRQHRLSRNAILLCSALFSFAFFILAYATTGFIMSIRLSEDISRLVEEAAVPTWQNPENFAGEFSVLNKLGKCIDTLKSGHPSPLIGPWLFRRKAAASMADRIYHWQLYRLVMSSTLGDLREELYFADVFSEDGRDRLYSDLKTYLLLTKEGQPYRSRGETEGLSRRLLSRWQKILTDRFGEASLPGGFEASLEVHADRYSAALTENTLPTNGLPPFNTDIPSASNAREALYGNPGILSLYHSVLNSAVYTDITLSDIISKDGLLTSEGRVRGFYTKSAFEKGALSLLDQAANQPHRKDWVLGTRQSALPPELRDKRALARALKEKYFEEYAGEWNRFLSSLRAAIPPGYSSLAGKLKGFASETQGLRAVLLYTLKEVNLVPEKNKHAERAVSSRLKKSPAGRMVKEAFDSRSDPRAILKTEFEPLERLAGVEGSKGLLFHYLDGTNSLGEAMNQISFSSAPGAPALAFVSEVFAMKPANPLVLCWNQASNIEQQVPDHTRSWLAPLLQEPLSTIAANLMAEGEIHLNEKYRTMIFDKYTQRLQGRFPISRESFQDANPEDINLFFNPSSGIFPRFMKDYLQASLITNDGTLQVKQWNGIRPGISPEALASLTQGAAFSERAFQPMGEKMRDFPFTLTLFPSDNAASVSIHIGGSNISVGRGQAARKAQFVWPGENAHKGAQIEIVLANGKKQTLAQPGPWGLLRLLQTARHFQSRENGFTVSWRIRAENRYDVDVRAEGEIRDADTPFTQVNFYEFICAPDLIKPGQKGVQTSSL